MTKRCTNTPTDAKLYAKVKADAKRRFKAWPSAYGSGWLVQEYKRRGGGYKQVCSAPSRKKKGKGRRKGLGYPSQPCGLDYARFRSGWTFKDAYDMVAFRGEDSPKGVSQRMVLRQLRKLKQDEYERYLEDCAVTSQGAKPSKRVGDCSKICTGKGKPCGRTCIRRQARCRRPSTTACALSEVQLAIDFSAAPTVDAEGDEPTFDFGFNVPHPDDFQEDAFAGLGRRRKRRAIRKAEG